LEKYASANILYEKAIGLYAHLPNQNWQIVRDIARSFMNKGVNLNASVRKLREIPVVVCNEIDQTFAQAICLYLQLKDMGIKEIYSKLALSYYNMGLFKQMIDESIALENFEMAIFLYESLIKEGSTDLIIDLEKVLNAKKNIGD